MFIILKKYMSLTWRKYGKPKVLICLPLVLSVIYFEWFSYILLPYQWPSLDCGLVENVHKILFVADPQILGENMESAIARSDCDLSLKARFEEAVAVSGTQKFHAFIPLDKSRVTTKIYYFSDGSEIHKINIIPGDEDLPFEEIVGFVACVYDKEWWLAHVDSKDEAEKQVTVSFLHPKGPSPSFTYPRKADILAMPTTYILGKLNPTTATSNEMFTASSLKSTFNYAYNYVKPDIVIFLGDLMDEGSIASPQQYERYYKRFRNIFKLHQIPENQTIFLPGDNDIGGENEEVTEYKVRRFDKYFPPKSDVLTHKNIKFIRVNSMLRMFPDEDVSNDTSIRILLSHMPLLGIHSYFGEQAIDKLKPLLIFSAHDHKSVHLVTGKNSPVRELVEILEVHKSAWRFNLQNTGRVNEIVVPTSSYRMGTPNFGFGVALLSEDGNVLCYLTLWSPDRLYHLTIYCVVSAIVGAAYLLYFLVVLCSRARRNVNILNNKYSV